MRKKLLLGIVATTGMLVATSCSNEELNIEPTGNEVEVSFTLGLENSAQTRAISDGTGADRLVYAVFDAEGKRISSIEAVDETGVTFPTTRSLRLAKGQTYKVAFWAQDSDCKAYTVNTEDMTVGVSYDDAVNNDETRDAFFKTVEFTVSGNTGINVVMKRPFAQINVGVNEEDWTAAVASGIEVVNSQIIIDKAATSISLLDGKVSGETVVTYALNAIPTETLEADADNDGEKESYRWLSMSYILVNDTNESDTDGDGTYGDDRTTVESMQFTFDPAEGNDIVFSEGLNSVPVQRNYRTNLLGNILTGKIDFNISIDPIYDNDINYPDGSMEQQLEFAATFGGMITLTEDATLTSPLVVANDMIIEANGYTINGALNVSKGAKLTVNKAKIVSEDTKVSAITSNGELELNEVEITSARHGLRIESGKVVINGGTYKVAPVTASTLHALNIGDDGTEAEVVIKCGTFIGPKGTVADSGSAVNVYSGSTVTIEGGNFSGGKLNTIVGGDGSTISISGGEFDQDPSKYLAEGYKASEIEEGKWLVAVYSIVSTPDNLVEALENGEDVVFYGNIKIDPASMSNAYGKTGINIKNGQTLDGNGYTLDIKGAGGTWDSGICTTGGLIKDITVTGSFRGIFIKDGDHTEQVILENVIIDGTTYTISCDQAANQGLKATNSTFKGWTSFAGTLGTAEFINCYFGEGNGYSYCRPYAPTTFVGCDFEAGFEIDPRAAVTFENCTIGGVALTAENLSTLVTSNIANATVK